MPAHMATHPFAFLMALVGMLCLVSWPLARSRHAVLLIQIGIGISFGLHYAILGNLTAGAVNGLGSVQIALMLCLGGQPGLKWVSWIFIPAVVAAAFLTWQGAPTLMAAAGTLLIALGRAQSHPIRMRILILAGCPFWIAHDLLVSSPVIIADLLSLLTGVFLLLRQCPPPADMGRHTHFVATCRALSGKRGSRLRLACRRQP